MNPAGEELWIEGDGRPRLLRRRWKLDRPRAAVLIIHGYAEHSGRYAHVAAALNDSGFDAHALDLRGHGRSEGVRGHVRSFSEYHEDLIAFSEAVAGEAPALPIFILGHSMGGLVVLSALARLRPIRPIGFAVSCPFLAVAEPPPAWKLTLGRVMASLWPTLALPSGIQTQYLSTDPSIGEAYAADPLVFKTVTAGWFKAASKEIEHLKLRAGRILPPALVMIAEADRVANPALARPLFEKFGSHEKRYVGYPGFYHEIFNEREREKPLGEVKAWIEKCLADASASK